jgi:GNAT superfamily N-acetyltransferase
VGETTLVFEDFTRRDQEEVRALILAGLEDNWGSLDDSLNPDLDDLAGRFGHGRTIVTRDNQGIAATGTVLPRDDGSAEVVRMSVRRDRRGEGIGRAVLTELLTTARAWGNERVVLETSSAWTPTVAFYLANGFEITRTTDGEFGCDTWFRKEL